MNGIVKAQQTGISDVSHIPDSSAVLDVYSTSKGILIPRVTDSTAITSPADGLFAYFTATNSFWYFNSDQWVEFFGKIDDSVRLGGTNDYMAVGEDGYLMLRGDATAFDDLKTPALSTDKGDSDPPDDIYFLTYFRALGFDPGKTEDIYFMVQLPHSYKEGSDIYPHIHWFPTTSGTGNVVWTLEYSWANVNGTFPALNTISTVTAADGINKHQIAALPTISGTGKTLSSMIVCHLYRKGTDSNDNYSADAGLLEFDFHYEIDSFGSNTEYTK